MASKQMAFSQSNQSNFRITARNLKSFIRSKIGHYLLGQSIGKGGFATVYRAIDVCCKKQFAVKVIDLERMTEKHKQSLRREISIHSKLNHPNIPKLYEVIEKSNKVYMVMELIQGVELFQYIRSYGPLQEKQAVKVFHQVCVTVQHLHDQGIAHRDIKAENMMIDSCFRVKIFDFGLAKSFKIGENVFNHTFCGSPSYCCPQIIDNKAYSPQSIDIWCLGVTLFVMLEACLPFDDFKDEVRKQNICNFRWHATKHSSQKAIQVYSQIFVPFYERIKIGGLLCCDLFSKQCFQKEDELSGKKMISSAAQNSQNLKNIEKISGQLKKAKYEFKTEISVDKFGDSFEFSPLLLVKSDYQKRLQILKTEEARVCLSCPKRYPRASSEISNKSNQRIHEKRRKVSWTANHDIKIASLKISLKNSVHSSVPDQEQKIDRVKSDKNEVKNKISINSVRLNKSNFQKKSSCWENLIKNYPKVLK